MSMRRRCCALGVNPYSALRRAGALPGDLVAAQGIGGLGHLGIQFASKFGYKVAAIGRVTATECACHLFSSSLWLPMISPARYAKSRWARP